MAGKYETIKPSAPLQDPFYVVKEEVTQSMQGVTALYDRWKELFEKTNTASNDEFKWSMEELKKSVKSIEGDIAELEDTINVVENNRTKFKIDENELRNRRRFVNEVKTQLKTIAAELSDTRVKGKLENDQRELLTRKKPDANGKFSRLEQAIQQDNDTFIQGQRDQQTQIIREQDQDLDQLNRTVGNLKEIGITIGGALQEQEGLIAEIEEDVDRADTGIKGAMQKVNKLLDSTSERNQYIIIIILLLALVGLIVLVIYLP